MTIEFGYLWYSRVRTVAGVGGVRHIAATIWRPLGKTMKQPAGEPNIILFYPTFLS